MRETRPMSTGGYAFIPGVMQYSAGVAALPGHRIERVRFSQVISLADGFARIADYLKGLGRPLTAFCACEMRSPAPFSEEGFKSFNNKYAAVLREWGLMDGDVNPVARSNVCPEINPPAEPGFHAFCYTVADGDAPESFVIAGSGEAPEGKGNYKDHIVRRGDTSSEGLREKARWVMREMERRMSFFDAGWPDVTAVQLYTVHDVHPFLAEEIAQPGAASQGVTWHFDRPPVRELEYEMDCRRVLVERVLSN
jgi:hypothetical protein